VLPRSTAKEKRNKFHAIIAASNLQRIFWQHVHLVSRVDRQVLDQIEQTMSDFLFVYSKEDFTIRDRDVIRDRDERWDFEGYASKQFQNLLTSSNLSFTNQIIIVCQWIQQICKDSRLTRFRSCFTEFVSDICESTSAMRIEFDNDRTFAQICKLFNCVPCASTANLLAKAIAQAPISEFYSKSLFFGAYLGMNRNDELDKKILSPLAYILLLEIEQTATAARGNFISHPMCKPIERSISARLGFDLEGLGDIAEDMTFHLVPPTCQVWYMMKIPHANKYKQDFLSQIKNYLAKILLPELVSLVQIFCYR
jgi:hypothetical protein